MKKTIKCPNCGKQIEADIHTEYRRFSSIFGNYYTQNIVFIDKCPKCNKRRIYINSYVIDYFK